MNESFSTNERLHLQAGSGKHFPLLLDGNRQYWHKTFFSCLENRSDPWRWLALFLKGDGLKEQDEGTLLLF